MLTQIDVMSENAIELPILGVTPKSSFLIKKVTGLNPPDRNLFIGDYSQDGGIYQGRRVGPRNVVFTIDLNPNPALGESVSSLRQTLYKAFIDPQVDGDYLKIVFYDEEDKETYLVGYCEKFESELFDSETMCQISLICPDPYIRDNQDTIHSSDSGWITVPFTYEGTAETGFVARIYVTAPTDQITLENNGKRMKLMAPEGSFYEVDDIITIDTIRGQRGISLTKSADLPVTPVEFNPPTGYAQNTYVFYGGGVWRLLTSDLADGTHLGEYPGEVNDYWEFVSTPIVAHLTPESRWLELHSVSNNMKVYGASTNEFVGNIKSLRYTASHWGV